MSDIDLDCVDGTGNDSVVQTFRRMYPHAQRVHSVGHLVHSILGALGSGRQIRRLRIFGHGAPGYQGLGQSAGGPPATSGYRCIQFSGGDLAYRDVLAQLCGRFARWTDTGLSDGHGRAHDTDRSGWVEMHGCNVAAGAEGLKLIVELSALWRVNVAGGSGYQIPNPGFEGPYVVAYPNRTLQTKMGTPVTAMTI